MGERVTLSNPAGGHSLLAGWHRMLSVRHRVQRLPSPKDRGHKEIVYGPPASLARWADKLQKEIRVNHLKTAAPICVSSHALGSSERQHLPLEETLPRAVLVCPAAQIKAWPYQAQLNIKLPGYLSSLLSNLIETINIPIFSEGLLKNFKTFSIYSLKSILGFVLWHAALAYFGVTFSRSECFKKPLVWTKKCNQLWLKT